MKLSVSSLAPSSFAREIALPTGRFAAILVDLDEDDIPTTILAKPIARSSSRERARVGVAP